MIKYRATLVSFAIAAVLSAGCRPHGIKGDGDIATDTRPVSDFSVLEASGALHIEWSSGQAVLNVMTDRNLLPHIKTVMSGSTLRVSIDEAVSPSKEIKIVASSAALKRVGLNGSIHLNASGLSGPSLMIASAGAVNISASGSVDDVAISMNGASNLSAASLKTRTAKVSLIGASRADISVDESLKVAIKGAGALTYSGNPKTVEQDVKGASTVRHRQ